MTDRIYLIRKGGAWYRPNSEGYTDRAILAGRYTLSEAVSITHPNGQDGPRDGMAYVSISDVKEPDFVLFQEVFSALKDCESMLSDIAEGRTWGAIEEQIEEARAVIEKAQK